MNMLIIAEVIFQAFYHFLRFLPPWQKTADVLVMISEPYRLLYKWNYVISSRIFSFFIHSHCLPIWIHYTCMSQKGFLFIGPDFPFLEQLFLFFEH